MQRIGAALPLDPGLAGSLGVEVVLDLHAHVAGKFLCAFSDEQVVIGFVHHLLRDYGGRADSLDGRDAARALARAVHAARIELDDAVGIWQPAVPDARLLGVELDEVDAGDQRVEHVAPCVIIVNAFCTHVTDPPFLYWFRWRTRRRPAALGAAIIAGPGRGRRVPHCPARARAQPPRRRALRCRSTRIRGDSLVWTWRSSQGSSVDFRQV